MKAKSTPKKPRARTERAKPRSVQRVVMPRKRAWLSERTIERISDRLHENIQFYNEHGQPDNHSVLKAVENCLKEEA